MNRFISRTTMLMFGVFLVSCLGALAYHAYFVWPLQKCEQAGAWWDARDRQCLTPLPIWRITGRVPSAPAVKPS